jgi:NAD(P) transhydrogenase subunit alpha
MLKLKKRKRGPMRLGIPKETVTGETRVAIAPDNIKKFTQKGFQVQIESGAGALAGFSDKDYTEKGAQISNRDQVLASDLVAMLNPPNSADIAKMKSSSWWIGLLESYQTDLKPLATAGINAIAMELVPRTSRAQSMDVLSSQANIAGYRAVLEAAIQYPRFLPMMMTSAGMAKPAKLIVLGVGVAGLQAIATARRLGASVDAFDIRPEVKEQILSCGAKPLELNIGESGTGAGGYAKELSEDAKARQQKELTEK